MKWTQEELDQIDRETGKLMCMNGMLHPRANVSRLYLPRAEGGRGLLNTANCVTIERKGLRRHVRSTRERLLKMGQRCMKDEDLGPKEYKMAKAEERRQDWENKPLHGCFLRSTDELTVNTAVIFLYYFIN